jgi:hypothetical protein
MFKGHPGFADVRRMRTILASKPEAHDAEAVVTPADGTNLGPAKTVTLRWQHKSEGAAYRVYFGIDPNDLALLGEVAQENRIVGPELGRQSQYFWRVDAVQPDGSISTGKVNSFRTGALVGWWRFDEKEGPVASDSSGFGNHGRLMGDPQWCPGVRNGALELDGQGDYVVIDHHPIFDITDEITIAAWFKVNVFNERHQALITKADNTWRIQRRYSSKGYLSFACGGVDVPNLHQGRVDGRVDVNDGAWHHVVGIYDRNRISLYIDGRLDWSEEGTGYMNTNERDVIIGTNTKWPSRFWNGLVDDVRIYSYALSAKQIRDVYASNGPEPNVSSLIEQ